MRLFLFCLVFQYFLYLINENIVFHLLFNIFVLTWALQYNNRNIWYMCVTYKPKTIRNGIKREWEIIESFQEIFFFCRGFHLLHNNQKYSHSFHCSYFRFGHLWAFLKCWLNAYYVVFPFFFSRAHLYYYTFWLYIL